MALSHEKINIIMESLPDLRDGSFSLEMVKYLAADTIEYIDSLRSQLSTATARAEKAEAELAKYKTTLFAPPKT